MASISVVLLGLNPETRLRPVVEYLKSRGVPGEFVSREVWGEGRTGELEKWLCEQGPSGEGMSASCVWPSLDKG